MELEEWLGRFAPLDIWDYRGRPTDEILSVYPYFFIDIVAAWQKAGPVGAREVLQYAKRRMQKCYNRIISRMVVLNCYDYAGIDPIAVTDSGEMSCGYYRRWEEGIFLLPNGEVATELLWHRHDSNEGMVELFISCDPQKEIAARRFIVERARGGQNVPS